MAAYAGTKAKMYLRAKYGKGKTVATEKATYAKAEEREQLLAELQTAIMEAVAGLEEEQLVELRSPAESLKS